MSRQLLIVEDNGGVALLLAELAAELGFEHSRAKGGSEAVELLQARLPDLVILDVVLDELDGFQVANALRALPGGEAVPLVLVSGVYKKLPDAFVERVKPRFLPKPFDRGAIRQVVEEIFGAAEVAPGVQRGRFTTTPPAELLSQLCERRATGVLDVVQAEVRRRLFFQAGQIRFAQSNVRAESAGGMQVAAGTLASAAFDRAVALARTARLPLHEALVATQAMSAAQVTEALRAQTNEVAVQSLGMQGADWTFTEGDVEKQPDVRRHPIVVLLEYARRAVTPEAARAALASRLDRLVSKSEFLDRELFTLRTAWPGEFVTALAPRTRLGDLVERLRDEDRPLLWALVTSRLLMLEEAAASPGGATASPTAAAAVEADADLGKTFTPEEREARRFILGEHQRTRGMNHYELLGVSGKASEEDARRAYLELARRYHADAYAQLDLGSARLPLADLFQRLGEATNTLGDAKRRAEYDIYLDRTTKGLPTDVAAIMRAEQLFQRGEIVLKANKGQEALDLFDQAIQLNATEPEFHAYRGFALYRAKGVEAVEEAKACLLGALKDSPNLASAYVLLGLMAREQGQDAEAIALFVKAIELDKHNEVALRELRALRRKKEKGGETKSIFSKLFGR